MKTPRPLTAEQVQQIRDGSYGQVAKSLHISVRRAKAIHDAPSFEEALKFTGQQETQSPTPAGSRSQPVRTATTLERADVVAFIPKRFEMHSILLWQAKEAAEREWNWPKMEPDDFLDTYLHESFKQRGIILGAYKVVKEGNDDSQGHLQRGRQLAKS